MDEPIDWRLTNQQNYLMGVSLTRHQWYSARPGWDHDHCEFCWAKFGLKGESEMLTEGYCTEDGYYWVCVPCFNDFYARFKWK